MSVTIQSADLSDVKAKNLLLDARFGFNDAVIGYGFSKSHNSYYIRYFGNDQTYLFDNVEDVIVAFDEWDGNGAVPLNCWTRDFIWNRSWDPDKYVRNYHHTEKGELLTISHFSQIVERLNTHKWKFLAMKVDKNKALRIFIETTDLRNPLRACIELHQNSFFQISSSVNYQPKTVTSISQTRLIRSMSRSLAYLGLPVMKFTDAKLVFGNGTHDIISLPIGQHNWTMTISRHIENSLSQKYYTEEVYQQSRNFKDNVEYYFRYDSSYWDHVFARDEPDRHCLYCNFGKLKFPKE